MLFWILESFLSSSAALNSGGEHFQMQEATYAIIFQLALSKSVGNMLSVLMLRGRFEEIPRLGPKNEN